MGGIEQVSLSTGAAPVWIQDWPFYGLSVGAALVFSRRIGTVPEGCVLSEWYSGVYFAAKPGRRRASLNIRLQ